MCKESQRHNRCVRKRQPYILLKRIREIRKALNGERQGTVITGNETSGIELTQDQTEAPEAQM